MAESFDEFMDDVEKDIRQEQYEKLWKKYGKFIMWGVGGVIAIAVTFKFYNDNRLENLRLTSEKYSKALSYVESGSHQKAAEIFQSITSGDSKTYAALSRIMEAQQLSRKGGIEFKQAQEKLKLIYTDKSYDIIFRDFAKLTYVKNEMDLINVETLESPLTPEQQTRLAEVSKLLSEISTDESPWKMSAMDIHGLVMILTKDYPKASEIFISLAQMEEVPQSLRFRANMMTQYIVKQMNEKQS